MARESKSGKDIDLDKESYTKKKKKKKTKEMTKENVPRISVMKRHRGIDGRE